MLGLEAQPGVEDLGSVVFDLYFNVRNAALRATFVYRFKQGPSDAPASGFRRNVEVFDAGEVCARGDVEAVGEDEETDDPVLCQGGKYFHFSGLNGTAQSICEILGDRFAVSEKPFEKREGFGETLC